MRFGFWRLLAFASASTEVLYWRASALSVSPGRMVCTAMESPVGEMGLGELSHQALAQLRPFVLPGPPFGPLSHLLPGRALVRRPRSGEGSGKALRFGGDGR